MNNLILDGRTKVYFTGDTLKEHIIKNDETKDFIIKMKDGNIFSPYVSVNDGQWVVGLIGNYFYCDTRNSIASSRISDLWLNITVSKNRVYTFNTGTSKNLECTRPVKNKILKFLLKERRLEELYERAYMEPVRSVVTEKPDSNPALKLLSIEKEIRINHEQKFHFALPDKYLNESERFIDNYFDYKFDNLYEENDNDIITSKYRYTYDVRNPFIENGFLIYKAGQEEQAIELLKSEVLC